MVETSSRRLVWLLRLTLLGLFLTVVVILVGAWTRLVDAGLGCPDWPGCYGQAVVPSTERAFAHSPDHPLESFKAWVEMFHRYLASGLGLVVLSIVVMARSLKAHSISLWRISTTLLIIILMQGAFGAFTVTLKLWPQVVTLHLLGGLSVLTLFLWLHLRIRQFVQNSHGVMKITYKSAFLWWVAGMLLVVQLALGGWVSSNYAGIACQGFPTCNTQWWPQMDLSEGFHLTQTVGPNYLHGQLHADARTAIHMMHRVGALLLGIALILLYWDYRELHFMKQSLNIVLGIYVLQAIIGIANVLWWLPLWLALLHTAGATALVISFIVSFWLSRYEQLNARTDTASRAVRLTT
ncbi:COX15/CtaA family protein [Halomonas vilamensis]|uniref:COX15/CtaA family protein n=1 Tax=Vreelandella vilamensis TaxID=531309 RepID=A0ABU1H227_9GAMM|nr:COX15/CtaA family protein [Halomonas vilamensis]MDR5898366.1 COX15/CtaA family protein [Halomonas vilamensis]